MLRGGPIDGGVWLSERGAEHRHSCACEQVMAVKGYDGLRAMVEAANLDLETFMPEVGLRLACSSPCLLVLRKTSFLSRRDV